jgi:hypothetical protein
VEDAGADDIAMIVNGTHTGDPTAPERTPSGFKKTPLRSPRSVRFLRQLMAIWICWISSIQLGSRRRGSRAQRSAGSAMRLRRLKLPNQLKQTVLMR